jgi:large subunit ribosomal protein L28
MRVCQITGKKTITGHNVSKSVRRTKRKFFPNIQKHRLWLQYEKKFITLKICTKALKTIDKYGLETVLLKLKNNQK